jgi:hypothetical protein
MNPLAVRLVLSELDKNGGIETGGKKKKPKEVRSEKSEEKEKRE